MYADCHFAPTHRRFRRCKWNSSSNKTEKCRKIWNGDETPPICPPDIVRRDKRTSAFNYSQKNTGNLVGVLYGPTAVVSSSSAHPIPAGSTQVRCQLIASSDECRRGTKVSSTTLKLCKMEDGFPLEITNKMMKATRGFTSRNAKMWLMERNWIIIRSIDEYFIKTFNEGLFTLK